MLSCNARRRATNVVESLRRANCCWDAVRMNRHSSEGRNSGLGIKRLVVASNRLPVTISKQGKKWSVQPSSGGLIRVLAPVLSRRGGLWIGWSGVPTTPQWGKMVSVGDTDLGYVLEPVWLTEKGIISIIWDSPMK